MWIVDAYNVLGARPDGWWRHRALALARLCDAIAAWRPDGAEVVVVVDGWPKPEVPEGRAHGITVRYASRSGPDGADRAIVELVDGCPDPGRVTVVSSDAALRGLVVARGATVLGAGTFRDRIAR